MTWNAVRFQSVTTRSQRSAHHVRAGRWWLLLLLTSEASAAPVCMARPTVNSAPAIVARKNRLWVMVFPFVKLEAKKGDRRWLAAHFDDLWSVHASVKAARSNRAVANHEASR